MKFSCMNNFPAIYLCLFAGFFDNIAEVLGFIAQPNVTIFVDTMIVQVNMVTAAFFSMLLLGRRYIALEVMALSLAVFGVLCVIYSIIILSMEQKEDYIKSGNKSSNINNPTSILIDILSCCMPAMVLKEMVFMKYAEE